MKVGGNLKEPLIINIQKCSIHDGPGIRTTVFFQGMSIGMSMVPQSGKSELLYGFYVR